MKHWCVKYTSGVGGCMEMYIIPVEENQLCDWRSSSSAYVMVQQKIK
jgi:hypothetical protein